MKKYHLFISHSWKHDDHYGKLVNLLEERPYFKFKNFSIPMSRPIDTKSERRLKRAIRNKMSRCHCIVIMAGVYASYSYWIDQEIRFALEAAGGKKPIVAVKPRGNHKIAKKVKEHADLIVNWNTEAIIEGIRKVAI